MAACSALRIPGPNAKPMPNGIVTPIARGIVKLYVKAQLPPSGKAAAHILPPVDCRAAQLLPKESVARASGVLLTVWAGGQRRCAHLHCRVSAASPIRTAPPRTNGRRVAGVSRASSWSTARPWRRWTSPSPRRRSPPAAASPRPMLGPPRALAMPCPWGPPRASCTATGPAAFQARPGYPRLTTRDSRRTRAACGPSRLLTRASWHDCSACSCL